MTSHLLVAITSGILLFVIFGSAILATIAAGFSIYIHIRDGRFSAYYGIEIDSLVKWWEWVLLAVGLWVFFGILLTVFWVFA
jgi:hypothetical protein